MKYEITPSDNCNRWLVWAVPSRLESLFGKKSEVVFKRECEGALEKCIEYKKLKTGRVHIAFY